MILSREAIQRMITDEIGGGGGGAGISGSALANLLTGYATQDWVGENYISIEFFSRLFQAHGTENGVQTDIDPNDMDSTITSIESMFGFWTDYYLSALGNGGGLGSTLYLSTLADVLISSPANNQVLTYNSTLSKWVNANAQAGVTQLSDLSDVTITNVQTNQVLIYDYSSSKWVNSSVKTINGYSIFGTGNIDSGSGTGNYVAKAGDTMSGLLKIAYSSTGGGLFGSQGLWISRSGEPDYGATFAITCYNNNGLVLSGGYQNGVIAFYDGSFKSVITILRNLNVGIGNTSPSYKLDVSGEARITGILRNSDIRATTGEGLLTIYSSDWGGVQSNEWAVGSSAVNGVIRGMSRLYFSDVSNTRYDIITGKGGTMTGRLILDFDNDADAGSADSGSMRIGTASGNHLLFDGNEIIAASGTSAGTLYLQYNGGSIECGGAANCSFNVYGNIYSSGAVTALSDARKKNVQGEAKIGVEQIADAPAVQFLWKGERAKEGVQVGTLAQYWQGVLPEVVMDKGGELSMQYGVAALVSAIITARKVVDHERRISELEKENERLKTEVEQLRLN